MQKPLPSQYVPPSSLQVVPAVALFCAHVPLLQAGCQHDWLLAPQSAAIWQRAASQSPLPLQASRGPQRVPAAVATRAH